MSRYRQLVVAALAGVSSVVSLRMDSDSKHGDGTLKGPPKYRGSAVRLDDPDLFPLAAATKATSPLCGAAAKYVDDDASLIDDG